MKKNTLLLLLFVGAISMSHAQVNLGKLKDKVKDKTSDVSKSASPSSNNMEKGNAAFELKNYEEAKNFYQKAYNASSSDYNKSQIKGQMNDCDVWIKYCSEIKAEIENLNSQKKYDALIKLYDEGKGSTPYEKKCICDDDMKTLMENARKGAVLQKEQAEKDAIAAQEKAASEKEANKYRCGDGDLSPDNGVNSDVHKKYVKKIVFSKSEIIEGKENEASFTSTFTLTDDIFNRVYLEKSLQNEAMSIGNCSNIHSYIKWTFNEGSFNMPEWLAVNNLRMDTKDKETSFQTLLSPSASMVTTSQESVRKFVKIVQNLPVGTYKIKLEAIYDIPKDEEPQNGRYTENCRLWTTKFGPEKVLAEGEFTLIVTEEGKRALYKKVCATFKHEIDWYNQPAYKTVSNASTLVKASKEIDWNQFTLLKMVGTDWKYNKNVFGVILSRESDARLFLLNKEDGHVYNIGASFFQENTSSGGSTYGTIKTSVGSAKIGYLRQSDVFCKECIGK